MTKEPSVMPTRKRLSSIDHFRGVAIFLMILVNSLAAYGSVPSWLEHAPGNGYTIADLVAPMFLFAMGLSYSISFNRRITTNGKRQTIAHFMKRYSTLFIFGLIGNLLVFQTWGWETLQTLGVAGLFSLGFMFVNPEVRVVASFGLTMLYQIGISKGIGASSIDPLLNGAIAIVSKSFILLFASALGNWTYEKGKWQTTKGLISLWIALTVIGVGASYFIPLNRELASFSFIMFSSGLCSFAFTAAYIFADLCHLRVSILEILGRNSLVQYMFSSVLILVENEIIPSTASLTYVALGSTVIILVCILSAMILDAKKIYIRL
jgi:predicted acyltransferase